MLLSQGSPSPLLGEWAGLVVGIAVLMLSIAFALRSHGPARPARPIFLLSAIFATVTVGLRLIQLIGSMS